MVYVKMVNRAENIVKVDSLSNFVHLSCLSSFVDFVQSINNNNGAVSCVGDPLHCVRQFSNKIANTV